MIVPARALDRLRAATREAHHQLEVRLDVLERLSSSTERPLLIRRYRTMYAGAAILLQPWPIADDAAPHRDDDTASRQDDDTAPLPADGTAPIDAHPMVRLGSAPEALGFRYVINGSALGGRLILRTLEARGVDITALDFLDPHGARAGEVWRGFLALLERELVDDPEALDLAAAGAVKGFDYARSCLCGAADGAP